MAKQRIEKNRASKKYRDSLLPPKPIDPNAPPPKKRGNPNIAKIAKEMGVGFKKGVKHAKGSNEFKYNYADLADFLGMPITRMITKPHRVQLLSHVMDLTEAQLKRVQRNALAPVFLRIMVSCLLDDLEKNNIRTIEMLMDRVLGKANQPLNFSAEKAEITKDNIELQDESTLLLYLSQSAETVEPEPIKQEEAISDIEDTEYTEID